MGFTPQSKLSAKHTPAAGLPRMVSQALLVGDTVHPRSLAAFRFWQHAVEFDCGLAQAARYGICGGHEGSFTIVASVPPVESPVHAVAASAYAADDVEHGCVATVLGSPPASQNDGRVPTAAAAAVVVVVPVALMVAR